MEIATFEKHAATLEVLLRIPRVSISSQISLQNCLLRANLLETEAELISLRVSVIRWLYDLNQTIEPDLKFKSFDCKNQDHVGNASDFHRRMKIKSQPRTLISTAFSLVINPLPFADTSSLSAPPYLDQDEVMNNKKDTEESTLLL